MSGRRFSDVTDKQLQVTHEISQSVGADEQKTSYRTSTECNVSDSLPLLFSNRCLKGDHDWLISASKIFLQENEHHFPSFLDKLLCPAISLIGRRWETGEITFSQVHYASLVATQVVFELESSLVTGVTVRANRAAILCTANSDQHVLPITLCGALFRVQGWKTTCLAGNAAQLPTYLAQEAPDFPQLIVFSCQSDQTRRDLEPIFQRLADQDKLKNNVLLLCGRGFNGKALPHIPDCAVKVGGSMAEIFDSAEKLIGKLVKSRTTSHSYANS